MKKRGYLLAAFVAALALALGGCGAGNYYPGGMPMDPSAVPPVYGGENAGGDTFDEIKELPFVSATEQPASAFRLDANTAAYTYIKRAIEEGREIPPYAVRAQEMLNYFRYSYPAPERGLGVTGELLPCPWNSGAQLLTVGVKAAEVRRDERRSNVVLLLDVSGSMYGDDRLGLVQSGMSMLAREGLREGDTVSVVTYADGVRTVLEGSSDRGRILDAVTSLNANGGTGGARGLQTAYEVAERNFIAGGNNLIILCTDGDFNIGISDSKELGAFVSEKRESGIQLAVFGVGAGNLKSDKLDAIVTEGNGVYHYLDSTKAAHKWFVESVGALFNVVAKDAKSQVAFDPDKVDRYRLIGYENRLITPEEWEDVQKDAGEIGSGFTVTAVYEVILKEGAAGNVAAASVRYRDAETDEPCEGTYAYAPGEGEPSEDARFISAVTEFALILRNSEYRGEASTDAVLARLSALFCVREDEEKAEFLELVERYRARYEYHERGAAA